MLKLHKKFFVQNKQFVLILSSGRCGSTSVLNKLNSDDKFNIYGENYGTINNILQTIYLLYKTKYYLNIGNKVSNLNYKKSKYLGTEWYNNPSKINELNDNLYKNIVTFFNSDHQYIGYKEIRFYAKDLSYLNVLESIYNVKYVYLTRDIEEQAASMFKLKWYHQHDLNLKEHSIEEYKNFITKNNLNIHNFLMFKSPKQFIHKNISKDKNFVDDIYNFIIS